MSERKVVLDEPLLFDEEGNALREATERAERAEAELAKMKAAAKASGAAKTHEEVAAAPDADAKAAAAPAPETGEKVVTQTGSAVSAVRGGSSISPAVHAKGGVKEHDGSSSGDSESRRDAHKLIDEGDDASSTKQPPSPSSAAGEPGVGGGEEELRKDSMMAHLLDSLEAGKDIGHYGRLVFAMVARHFLPHDEVLAWMTKDEDFGEEDARLMLVQVEGRDYSPPRRDRILQWQSEQEFPILPNVDDPDCGNLYRNLNFPDEIYKHIGHYREQKMEAGE